MLRVSEDLHQTYSADSEACLDHHANLAGVIGFDAEGGFYLMHSTPNFPDNPADSDYKGARTTSALN